MYEKLMLKLENYYKRHKSKSVYFYPIALVYFKNKDYDKAYQVLIEGLERFPRYALALVLAGKILMEEKKYDAALAYLETAVNIQRSNSKALELLGECYELTGKFSEALKVYERLVTMEDNEEYKAKVVSLVSKVKPSSDHIEEILSEIDNKKELNGDSTIPKIELEEGGDEVSIEKDDEVTITMAKLYEKQGYIDDAIKIYKKILEKEPDNAEARESLDNLLSGSGLEEGDVGEQT